MGPFGLHQLVCEHLWALLHEYIICGQGFDILAPAVICEVKRLTQFDPEREPVGDHMKL